MLRKTRATVVIAMALFAVCWSLFDVVTVAGVSMEGTLYEGDRLLVFRTAALSFLPGATRKIVTRGSVVVAATPRPDGAVVKRVVGVGGDAVRMDRGTLMVNGRPFADARTTRSFSESWPNGDGETVHIPMRHYFLMSDNRVVAMDSRAFGSMREDSILGVVVGVLSRADWPDAVAQPPPPMSR